MTANRIYMPLSDDGTEVHYILGALNFTFGDDVHGGVWGTGTLEPSGQFIERVAVAPPTAA